MKALIDCKKNLELDLAEQKRQFNMMERDINSARIEINSLLRQEKRYKQWMMNHTTSGITEQLVKKIQEEGITAWTNQQADGDKDPYSDEKTWFLDNLTRKDAEHQLSLCPSGTFLIRASSAGNYALSITCGGTTSHCYIYQTSINVSFSIELISSEKLVDFNLIINFLLQNTTSSYGFSEPYIIYPSLKDLVAHYSTNSLEEHNDSLKCCLKYPLKCKTIQQLKKTANNAAQ